MAGGAIIAAAAAARERRIQSILDAFRNTDATTPKRARSPEELGVQQNDEFGTLIGDGVLVPGPTPGTWYMSEAGYAARNQRRATVRVTIVVVTLAIAALMVAFWIARGR